MAADCCGKSENLKLLSISWSGTASSGDLGRAAVAPWDIREGASSGE